MVSYIDDEASWVELEVSICDLDVDVALAVLRVGVGPKFLQKRSERRGGVAIVPIFGTRRLERVKENLGAAERAIGF